MTLETAINMEEFENAIFEWFSNATGLNVIWREQSGPQPDYPFGTLMITSGPTPVSPSWELRTYMVSGADPGKEVEMNVVVPCSFSISCQTYVKRIDSRNPQHNARNFMNTAQSSLALPSVLAKLRTKNISVINPGPVQNISAIIEDSYVSRANMDVVFGASLSLSEYAGYIDKVEIKSTEFGIDFIVDTSSV